MEGNLIIASKQQEIKRTVAFKLKHNELSAYVEEHNWNWINLVLPSFQRIKWSAFRFLALPSTETLKLKTRGVSNPILHCVQSSRYRLNEDWRIKLCNDDDDALKTTLSFAKCSALNTRESLELANDRDFGPNQIEDVLFWLGTYK